MKFGFVLPFGDARTGADTARVAEAAGWDGFFVWEPIWGVDPWVSLAAAAMVTERIRLGTMLTPIAIRKPWKLAGETATLDNLSNGRVILSVGLGAVDTGFANFGEPTDRKTRAELLNESLDILTGLWKGQPFNYQGKHYQVKETSFNTPPPPVQQPHIPIWVVGGWPKMKSMKRVLRYDGILPNIIRPDTPPHPTVEDIREIKAFIEQNRHEDTPFDLVVEGKTPGGNPEQAGETVRPWAEAGATWWIEALWEVEQAEVLARVKQGPPIIKA